MSLYTLHSWRTQGSEFIFEFDKNVVQERWLFLWPWSVFKQVKTVLYQEWTQRCNFSWMNCIPSWRPQVPYKTWLPLLTCRLLTCLTSKRVHLNWEETVRCVECPVIWCKILCPSLKKSLQKKVFVCTAFQKCGVKFEHLVHLYSGIYRLDILLANFTSKKAVDVSMLLAMFWHWLCSCWCPKQFLCRHWHQLRCWESCTCDTGYSIGQEGREVYAKYWGLKSVSTTDG